MQLKRSSNLAICDELKKKVEMQQTLVETFQSLAQEGEEYEQVCKDLELQSSKLFGSE
jgi:hypothetical protein